MTRAASRRYPLTDPCRFYILRRGLCAFAEPQHADRHSYCLRERRGAGNNAGPASEELAVEKLAIEVVLTIISKAESNYPGRGVSVNILGINSVYHDSAAALLVDGKLVVAVEEERFNRIKHGKLPDVDNPHQFPERRSASAWIMPGSPPAISITWPIRSIPELRRTRFRAEWWGIRGSRKTFLLRLGQVRGVADEILRRPLRQRFHFVPHHLAHAASAYFPSGFDRAAILIIDGIGEAAGSTLCEGRRHAHTAGRNDSTIRIRLASCGR